MSNLTEENNNEYIFISAVLSHSISVSECLDWCYYGGNIIDNYGKVIKILNGTLKLTPLKTNYIEFNKKTNKLTVNTSGFRNSGFIKLYSVITDETSIKSYIDYRKG